LTALISLENCAGFWQIQDVHRNALRFQQCPLFGVRTIRTE
jgi:hypothetical protein